MVLISPASEHSKVKGLASGKPTNKVKCFCCWNVDPFELNCVLSSNVLPEILHVLLRHEGVSGGATKQQVTRETKIPPKSIWDGEYPVVSRKNASCGTLAEREKLSVPVLLF
ncbi:hypothetical protein TNCV_4012251 [Trichonephila clavipes]|nr:hypothetical protein TNCV_4012251 [Trichonephila clavipes]